MDLYADNILDHYRHPRKKEPLPSPGVTHTEVNASCGDEITLELHIDNDHVVNVRWNGTGCAISQASMSMLAEELTGKSIEDLTALSPQNIFDLLGVPIGTRRMKCALLGLHALKNTLHKAQGEPEQDWNATTRA